jgi:UPF0755 protein
MESGKKRLATVTIAAIGLIAFLVGFIYFTYFLSSPNKNVIVEIPKGLGLKGIALKLEESGVIKNDKVFVLYVMIKGAQNKLKAGEYEFKPGDSMARVVEKLEKGDVIVRRITIQEGLTVNEIGELLEKNGIMSKEEFLKKALSREFARELLGGSISSFEGYLFPDTYYYAKGITSEEFIRMMVSRFKKVYESLKTESVGVNLTDQEIVILASIIEKETGNASERPLISAVFHNRLRLGMKLESDPTVIYGLGSDFNGNLTKDDLRTETSYNTYKTLGLPPAPIANPGKDSLQAALNPARVNYLYFVSKGDGSHHFSSNYRDHQEAVARYQKKSNITERKH